MEKRTKNKNGIEEIKTKIKKIDLSFYLACIMYGVGGANLINGNIILSISCIVLGIVFTLRYKDKVKNKMKK